MCSALIEPVRAAWLLVRAMRVLGEFDETQHPRDEAGKFTDGDGTLTPEQQFEKDKRDYLTPGEYKRLPPGIVKWKVAKRKAEAEAKAKAGGTKVAEPPPPPEVKPNGPTITERERAISERGTALSNQGTPWHEALAKARQEDIEKHGPMPANTLHNRNQAIAERTSEIHKSNPEMKWEKAREQAQREDVEKHGPWLEPDQVKEREALIASDKHWSVQDAIDKELNIDSTKPIPPRPEINPVERTVRQQSVALMTDTVAKELGHDPNLITVRDITPRTFELNGQTLSEAGHYNPRTGLIEINARQNIDRGTIIHEIQHAQFDYVRNCAEMERSALNRRWSRERAFDFQGTTRYFTKNGEVMAKYAKEIEAQTPHLSLFARAGLGSRELRIKPDYDGMQADDGVSNYSKQWWDRARGKGGYEHEAAVNETLSETLRREKSSAEFGDFSYTIAARFKELGQKITQLYSQHPEHVRRFFARKRA